MCQCSNWQGALIVKQRVAGGVYTSYQTVVLHHQDCNCCKQTASHTGFRTSSTSAVATIVSTAAAAAAAAGVPTIHTAVEAGP
jgi:hypothetical protein